MIRVTCTKCTLTILVPRSVQGNKGVCFGCGAPLKIPEAENPVQNLEIAFTKGARIEDRYEILGLTGKGGMGAVYSAHDHLLGEPVALKFMNPKLLRTQKGQHMFIREAQVARRLRHDNIVAVHDVSRTPEGILYLTMEYLQGQSLRSFLRARRPSLRLVEVRRVVRLLDQILAALEFAHAHIVHRDLKPENVMLLAGERLKVLDFGLAKALDSEIAADDRAGTAKPVLGTEAYASPEQKRLHEVDLRADLYTVGLLFYELLTLRTPRDPYVPVQKVRHDVSPSLEAVLERALREDREHRWPSAAEFRAALLDAFEQSYEQTVQPTTVVSAGRTVSTDGMVFLEGGVFMMGATKRTLEEPEHEVAVEPFYIDRYPVTVSQYQAFLDATGREAPRFWGESMYRGPDQPVVGVTWSDAMAYAEWCGKQLPTEAQWEFAARGSENRLYPWGMLPPDSTRCNFNNYLSMPSIVGMHEDGATPEGLQDMAGNVYEWTRDWLHPYADCVAGPPPDAPPDPPLRVARGGCWRSPADDMRCAHRRGFFVETQDAGLGFRCVVPAASIPSTQNDVE